MRLLGKVAFLLIRNLSIWEPKFQCPECEYEVTQRGSLVRHTKSVHRNSNAPSVTMKLYEKLNKAYKKKIYKG